MRAKRGVRIRPDVQVALDGIVDEIEGLVACSHLDLAHAVLEELGDGDDVSQVLLQPPVDVLLPLRSVVAGWRLGRVPLPDRLLAGVQKEHPVERKAGLAQGQGLRLYLRAEGAPCRAE